PPLSAVCSTTAQPPRGRLHSGPLVRLWAASCRIVPTPMKRGNIDWSPERAFIDENKQALGSRGTRHCNRGADRRLCIGRERAATDDIHWSTASISPRVSHWSNCQSVRIGFPRARERVAQFAAPDGVGSAWKNRPHRFLDLYLYQLAAHAALCSR